MPDWQRLARRRLTPLALDSAREDEIVAELAGHLEDLCADLVRQGTPEEEAVQFALSAAADWDELRREIHRAANEEIIMNYRVKTLWLPELARSLFPASFFDCSRSRRRLRLTFSGCGKAHPHCLLAVVRVPSLVGCNRRVLVPACGGEAPGESLGGFVSCLGTDGLANAHSSFPVNFPLDSPP